MCPVSGCARPQFPRSADVKRHINSVHLNRRVYRCSAAGCDKAYTRGDKLTAHIRRANGIVNVDADGDVNEW